MIDLSKAIELAQNYIDDHLHQDNQYIICKDEIFEEDNGWYIPFQSKKFLNSGDVEDIIVGNWPIFVDYNGVCFGMWRPFRLGGRKPIK